MSLISDQVCHLAVYFHSLEELHLNANSLLRNLRRDSTRGRHHLAKLKILSLEGCGLISWEEIAREMGALESSVIPCLMDQVAYRAQAGEPGPLFNPHIVNTSTTTQQHILASSLHETHPSRPAQHFAEPLVRHRCCRVLDWRTSTKPSHFAPRAGGHHYCQV